MNFKLYTVLVLVGLAVLFIIQNVAVVEVQFIFWSIQVSRALLMFLLLSVGIIAGWLLHSFISFRRGKIK
jgi:uncharacterized integral membrane protein